MSGHRDFNELVLRFTPERQARVVAEKRKLLADVLLTPQKKSFAEAIQSIPRVGHDD